MSYFYDLSNLRMTTGITSYLPLSFVNLAMPVDKTEREINSTEISYFNLDFPYLSELLMKLLSPSTTFEEKTAVCLHLWRNVSCLFTLLNKN